MMEVVADLVRRGIISPDAAQSFAERLQKLGGNLQGNVEQGPPSTPYQKMQANLNFVGAAARHFFPWLKDLDYPKADVPYPKSSDVPYSVARDAGRFDIGVRTKKD